jgi:protoporphyrinogen oxidase
MPGQTVVVIGAGPAGLTAAHELVEKSDRTPVVLEMSDHLGGISRTVDYKGYRIDIGGHRFFSKSDRVMDWWLERLPLEAGAHDGLLSYQGQERAVPRGGDVDPDRTDHVMLVRRRKSRIYYLGKFFRYPLRLDADTLIKLGLWRVTRIAASYLWARLRPIRPEENLEQFFVNRFGRRLYQTFFKSYTEKVWGVPCEEISATWGRQRIKGLNVGRAVRHALRKLVRRPDDLAQKETETSLIERFLYPKLGPGQMWETVAGEVRAKGGAIHLRHRVVKVRSRGRRIVGVDVRREMDEEVRTVTGEHFISTMPIRELVEQLEPDAPSEILRIARGLIYRDFVAVGLLLEELEVGKRRREGGPRLVDDNWIYVQEPGVHLGRLQIFNNWSPGMVRDPDKVWLGLEYFCTEGDEVWQLPDDRMIALAEKELAQIGIIDRGKVLDATVVRMPKAYPAYFGSFDQFDTLRSYLDGFENLFLIGRNGMHRYNNQDHSMLTAMAAVGNILSGCTEKASIWAINTEQEYHEHRAAPLPEDGVPGPSPLGPEET